MMKITRENGFFCAEYSQVGDTHLLKGIENQDQILSGLTERKVCYLAISDGVSTAMHSKEGAVAAVNTIKDLAEEISASRILMDDIKDIQNYVVKHWKEKIVSEWNQYAATINFAIYCEHKLLAGQIGDGLIGITVDEKSMIFQKYDDFYSPETAALCEAVLRKDFLIRLLDVKKTYSVYMVSDGIGKEIKEESYIPFERYLFELSQDPDNFTREIISWVKGLNKKNGDDKTLGYMRMEDL